MEDIKELKILLLGSSDSKKTEIFRKIIDHSHNSSIGVDFQIKNIKYKNQIYSIQLFDSAGLERFRSIRASYYHMCEGFFVVFNLSSENSLNYIKDDIDSLKEYIENPKIIILGNETQKDNNIPDDIIKDFLKDYPYKYFKICSQTGKNIDNALYSMIDLFDEEGKEKIKDNEIKIIKKKNIKKNKKSTNKKDKMKNNINNNKNSNIINNNKSSFNNYKLNKYLDF